MKKKFLQKNCKGADPTTMLIITFAVLIISVAVILYFYQVLNPADVAADTVCHNSVLARSAGVLPKESVPLNCKTDYICLSKDGSCEAMTKPEIIKVETKEEVYRVLAEEGASCWAMFGEGKADYIGDKFTHDLYCSICTQVGFDNSLESLFAIRMNAASRAEAGIPETYSNFLINREDFYEYLGKTNVSGKDTTYLDYFLGLKTSKTILDALKSNSYDFGYLDIKKQHFIMIGEFSEVGFWQSIVTGVAKGALLFIVLPIPYVGWIAADAIIVSTFYNPLNQKKGYMIGTVVKGESEHTYLSPTIIEANSEDYGKLGCADIKTLA